MRRFLLQFAAVLALCSAAFAQVYSNLDDNIPCWQNPPCIGSLCAGGVGYPTAWDQTFGNSTPSIDGGSMFLTESGSNYYNVMWPCSVGSNTSDTYFYGSYWISLPILTFPDFQSVGSDMYFRSGGNLWMFGTECDLDGAGYPDWHIWNQGSTPPAWISTGYPCTLSDIVPSFVEFQGHRVPGDTSCPGRAAAEYYDFIKVNGNSIGALPSECSGTSPYGNDRGIQFDLNGNSGRGTVSAYIDELTYIPSVGPMPCGPPIYNCDYAGTATVQTPAAPFSTSTLTNSTSQQSILSNVLISRVTEPTTGGTPCADNNWNSTIDGGGNGVETNTNTTLYGPSCSGGEHFVIGFNPTTLQVFPTPPAVLPNNCGVGAMGFSRSNPLVYYCMPQATYNVPGGGTANGTTIYTVTLPYASGTNLCGKGVGLCPDPSTVGTWATLYDLRNCPQATNANPTWASTMGIGIADSSIGESISWTGIQGTGHLFFRYIPGTGCQTFDTHPASGTHPIWYSTGGSPTTVTAITATWFIHDSFITNTWASIAQTGCVGSSCGGDGAPEWQMGTSNVVMVGQYAAGTGHYSLSPDYYYGTPNPQFESLLLSSPATNTVIATTNCSPCQDSHFSGDIQTDANPLIGTTVGTTNATWTAPYKNEVIGVTTDGTQRIFQFAKTWSSGSSATPLETGFQAANAIAAISQDRCTAFVSSDMLKNLGPSSSGPQYRWDIFAYGLCGNSAAPSLQTLTVTVTGSGTVTDNLSELSCPSVCSASYTTGTAVTLTATPTSGYSFTGWSGACSGAGACSVTMSSAQAVTATFTAITPPVAGATLQNATVQGALIQ